MTGPLGGAAPVLTRKCLRFTDPEFFLASLTRGGPPAGWTSVNKADFSLTEGHF